MKSRGKNDDVLLQKKLTSDNPEMWDVSNEIGVNLLTHVICNPDLDYVESLKAFRVLCMLRMNKDNDIYCPNSINQINWRYGLNGGNDAESESNA
jgi:hypothetical protein